MRVRRRSPLDHLPEEVVEFPPQPLVFEYLGATGEFEFRRVLFRRDRSVDVDARVAEQVARLQ